jgi:molecular chaperone DnaK
LVYTSEKTLKDAGEKVKPEDKKAVEDKIAALKEAQKNDNKYDIKNKIKDLSEAIQKVGAEMYKQQTPPAGETKPEDKKDEPKAEEGKYTEQK